MTGPILTNAERDREAHAVAQSETYAEAKARRREARVGEKIAARSRIAAIIAQPLASA